MTVKYHMEKIENSKLLNFFLLYPGGKHIRQNIFLAWNNLLYPDKTNIGMRPKISIQTKCPECGSPRVARTFDETVCNKCGLVLEDTVFVSGKM